MGEVPKLASGKIMRKVMHERMGKKRFDKVRAAARRHQPKALIRLVFVYVHPRSPVGVDLMYT